MKYTVYFSLIKTGEVVMMQEFDNYDEAVEIGEIFSNDVVCYQIVETGCIDD